MEAVFIVGILLASETGKLLDTSTCFIEVWIVRDSKLFLAGECWVKNNGKFTVKTDISRFPNTTEIRISCWRTGQKRVYHPAPFMTGVKTIDIGVWRVPKTATNGWLERP